MMHQSTCIVCRCKLNICQRRPVNKHLRKYLSSLKAASLTVFVANVRDLLTDELNLRCYIRPVSKMSNKIVRGVWEVRRLYDFQFRQALKATRTALFVRSLDQNLLLRHNS
ncbi:hypothetical protein DPMN_087396 [Dreissena polymorpha]|uniref:Uncharacterized protein n=1 Tax=Dreissena polymorpha TaxID=45954 RepID=A0A9D4KSQ4_DREPO|nr:hypothetical protein DPMN_087396 [Dreissena polymorpha]